MLLMTKCFFNFTGKYPRSVVRLNEVTGGETTYDRIRENDISYHDSVQMNDLVNGEDTFTMQLRLVRTFVFYMCV